MASISRSVNLLLRSSRSSLLRPRAVNPVQHVLTNERFAARNFATVFERTKPHVNVGMCDTELHSLITMAY
jgi:elongation factor Tu